MTRSELMNQAGHLQQWGGARLVTLGDGSERGVRAIEVRTSEGLEYSVLIDRAFDISMARYQGRSLAWHSPGGVVGPWDRETEGLGFLRSFGGGLFVTAGLDHILFPESESTDYYNYPARQSTEFGLHGRLSSTAGKLLGYGERWDGDECVITIEGEVRQASAFGENLVLRRTISTALTGRSIEWTDVVTNEGHYSTPHMMLYHINLGAPLLSPFTRLYLPSKAITWSTLSPDDAVDNLSVPPPTKGFVEAAFLHEMVPGADGRTRAVMVNESDPQRPWGVELDYDPKVFPHFFQWWLLDQGHYVVGFEPSTNRPIGRAASRDAGELVMLEPGDVRVSTTRLRVLDGPEECSNAIAEVAITAAGQGPK